VIMLREGLPFDGDRLACMLCARLGGCPASLRA
jgi:hypothetical protein